MNTEINDLRVVVKAAARKGRNVAMGGHSLGGSIATAYTTWDFNGQPGGRDLSGLVLIDGASSPTPVSAQQATDVPQQPADVLAVAQLRRHPGAARRTLRHGRLSVGEGRRRTPSRSSTGWPLLPSNLQPRRRVIPTNEGGFRLRRPMRRPLRRACAPPRSTPGTLAASGDPRGWVRDGAITPIQRWATMFSGWGLQNLDGTAWYHPLRLTIDSGAVGDGVANPAQAVLDVHSTDAAKLREAAADLRVRRGARRARTC